MVYFIGVTLQMKPIPNDIHIQKKKIINEDVNTDDRYIISYISNKGCSTLYSIILYE